MRSGRGGEEEGDGGDGAEVEGDGAVNFGWVEGLYHLEKLLWQLLKPTLPAPRRARRAVRVI